MRIHIDATIRIEVAHENLPQEIPVVNRVVTAEAVEVQPALLLDGVAVDEAAEGRGVETVAIVNEAGLVRTRRGFRSRTASNPTRLCDLRAVFPGARGATGAKTPDASF